jgi:2-amino-4-hydroxy-6-hydroxymethyldihydropteridine diphosphokinase
MVRDGGSGDAAGETVGEVSVLLGLGSNKGDRKIYLRRALELIGREERIEVVAVSSLIESQPEGGPPQGPFLNAAAEIRTPLSPHSLLRVLQRVESTLGRERTVRWGPREVDLDILLYDDRVLSSQDLEIPHPRMLERGFVLGPLVEIAPDRVHPVTRRPLRDHYTRLAQAPGHRPVPPPGSPAASRKEWWT